MAVASVESTRPVEAETPKSHVVWVEYAKGIAIIIVVLRHVVAGNVVSGNVSNGFVLYLHEIYPQFSFSLTVFFLVGGLFLPRSARKPLGQFTGDRLRRMVYPYFVWSLITYFIAMAMAQFTNGSVIEGWAELPYRLFVDPQNRFWFLYVMFIAVMLYAVLKHFKLPQYTFMGVAIALYFFGKVVVIGNESWANLTYFLIFLAVGAQYSEAIRNWVNRRTNVQLAVGAVVGYGIWSLVLVFGMRLHELYLADLFVVAATIATVMLSALLDRLNTAKVIAFLGEYSLEIYLVHGLAVSGTRIVLERLLNIYDPTVHIVLGLLAGIVFPLLLVYGAHLVGFKYLFTIPKAKPQQKPVLAPEA